MKSLRQFRLHLELCINKRNKCLANISAYKLIHKYSAYTFDKSIIALNDCYFNMTLFCKISISSITG